MDDRRISSERVASAATDALKNEALQQAVLVFGSMRILLTKGQRLDVADATDGDTVPEYPTVDTNLLDDSDSWLS
jgi:hypothetical protein